MDKDSCAACDSPLDGDRLIVTVGGKPVEVCCEACRLALKEADVSLHLSRPAPQ